MKIKKYSNKHLKFIITFNLLAYSFLLVNNCSKQELLPIQGVGAHRGASLTHPENTLAAFNEAIRLGAHMIEFDVRMTEDSALIVIHDSTLDRTTNGLGEVKYKQLSSILELDAGSWKNTKYHKERIPLFSKVIDIMPRNIWLNIHIKGGPHAAYRAAQIIVSKDRVHQSIFACKSESEVKIRKIDESLFVCNMDRLDNSVQYVEGTIESKAAFIQLKTRADSTLIESINKLKNNNININYYYTDSKERYIELINSRIDFVLTNNVEELLEVSKDLGINPVTPIFN